ncbi:MAG TPA: HD domain-containing protein [Thermoanaerobaculia bacterium]|nr:HD domain-containing protein [Thermoanaerobaculia bacterium]
MLSIRDPIHGFIRADALEAALIDSRPLQRLRHIRQLGMTFLVFPGAEHSRFSHAVGAMHLAGRVYDALAAQPGSPLDSDPRGPARRMVRAAGLLHDIGHAPFSHSAEDLFDDAIDHEAMTRRLLHLPEVEAIFAAHGGDLTPADVERLLAGGEGAVERLLAQIVSGELDADKMDYLLRDSLYCGVRYGSYDLERLLDTIRPLRDPATGEWGIGVEEGGVHALEALVMARYYMFTQVYFNVTGKVLELHLEQWLRESEVRWSSAPERFIEQDDLTVEWRMRASDSPHARAVLARQHYQLAAETGEHPSEDEKHAFEQRLAPLLESSGPGSILVSRAAKDPHRLGRSRVLVRSAGGGALVPMEKASHFIRHLGRIEATRVYARPDLRDEVARELASECAG